MKSKIKTIERCIIITMNFILIFILYLSEISFFDNIKLLINCGYMKNYRNFVTSLYIHNEKHCYFKDESELYKINVDFNKPKVIDISEYNRYYLEEVYNIASKKIYKKYNYDFLKVFINETIKYKNDVNFIIMVLSMMGIESNYGRVLISGPNTNGTFDYGPLGLNQVNIENEKFMKHYLDKNKYFYTYKNKYENYMAVSIRHIEELYEEFGEDLDHIIIVYNAGRSRLKRYINSNKNTKSIPTITNNYINLVKKIMSKTFDEISKSFNSKYLIYSDYEKLSMIVEKYNSSMLKVIFRSSVFDRIENTQSILKIIPYNNIFSTLTQDDKDEENTKSSNSLSKYIYIKNLFI